MRETEPSVWVNRCGVVIGAKRSDYVYPYSEGRCLNFVAGRYSDGRRGHHSDDPAAIAKRARRQERSLRAAGNCQTPAARPPALHPYEVSLWTLRDFMSLNAVTAALVADCGASQ